MKTMTVTVDRQGYSLKIEFNYYLPEPDVNYKGEAEIITVGYAPENSVHFADITPFFNDLPISFQDEIMEDCDAAAIEKEEDGE